MNFRQKKKQRTRNFYLFLKLLHKIDITIQNKTGIKKNKFLTRYGSEAEGYDDTNDRLAQWSSNRRIPARLYKYNKEDYTRLIYTAGILLSSDDYFSFDIDLKNGNWGVIDIRKAGKENHFNILREEDLNESTAE